MRSCMILHILKGDTQEEIAEEMTRQMEAMTLSNENALQASVAVSEAIESNVRTFLNEQGFDKREVEALATANTAHLRTLLEGSVRKKMSMEEKKRVFHGICKCQEVPASEQGKYWRPYNHIQIVEQGREIRLKQQVVPRLS